MLKSIKNSEISNTVSMEERLKRLGEVTVIEEANGFGLDLGAPPKI